MSYSFGMFFKQIGDAPQALRFISQVTKVLYKNGAEHIKNNKWSIPSLDHEKSMPQADGWFLYGLFTLKFVYWEKEQLIGLSGYKFPEEVEKMFDAHVCFQNSTDQDYPYKDWSNKITAFEEEKKIAKALSAKDVYEKFQIDKRDRNNEMAAYLKRSTLYKNIVKRLELEAYINGRDGESHMVIQTCAIHSIYEHSHLNAIIKSYTNSFLKGE